MDPSPDEKFIGEGMRFFRSMNRWRSLSTTTPGMVYYRSGVPVLAYRPLNRLRKNNWISRKGCQPYANKPDYLAHF